MIELSEMYAETFHSDGSFIGGTYAGSIFKQGVEFVHHDAVWVVERVAKYWDGMLIFHCSQQRSVVAR